jgi:hypothetical protein
MAARPPNREGPANGQPAGPTPTTTPPEVTTARIPARDDRGHGTEATRRLRVVDLVEYRCQRGGVCTCYGAPMGMRSWSP